MKLTRGRQPLARLRSRAFTLIDALFAMMMAGIMFAALYAGLAYGFKIVRMARENTRATQIMLEHMEIIRLYTWQQLTNAGPDSSFFLNTNPFTVPYYSVGNASTSLLYTVRVSLADAPVTQGDWITPASYAAQMRKISVRLDWTPPGGTNRSRKMSSYVTRNGLQTYVW